MKKTTVNKYLGSYTVSTSSGGTGGAVNSVNGKTGDVVLTKADLGLGNVDNTSDLDKPISTATQEALDLKADKSTTLSGYGIVDTYTKSESDSKYAEKTTLATVATTGSYNDLTDKPDIPESYTLPTASTTTLGGVKVDGTTITATAEGVISAPVADTPVATTETAGIVKPSSLTFDVEEDGTLVNKVAGSNCYIYGLKGIGSDDITIAADTTTTIPVGRLRNYNYENGDRLKVGDMLIDLKGNVAKVDRVNTAVLPVGSGPFGVNESSVLVQLQTREDDTLTTSSKEVVGAINELKTSTDSKLNKPASYAQADLPDASEHFGEFAIVTDLENALVWSNGTAWKQITLTDLA